MEPMQNSIQPNEQALMAEFAENLWRNYIGPKYEEASMSTVSFYRATVVENRGSRVLVIKQPFDEPRTVSCTNELIDQEVGTQVAVLKFGNGTAAMNHLAFMALANNGISNTAEIQEDLDELRDELETQADAQIDTWVQDTNPATSWTAEERPLHNNDLWYYSGTYPITVDGITIKPTGTYMYNASTNTWSEYAMQSNNLFDMVDGKTTIFYGHYTEGTSTSGLTPTEGDFFLNTTTDILYRYISGSWVEVTSAMVAENDYLVDPQTGNSYQMTSTGWILVQNLQGKAQVMNAYALCRTAASTTAKTATIEPTLSDYTPISGAQVTILFSYDNTASAPTLSVNGNTPKPIRAFADQAFTSDFNWSAYSTITFAYTYYSGNYYWVMTDPTAINKAAAAQATANGAQTTANSAQTTANTAATDASNALSQATTTSHFFWHDNSDGTHIASVSQDTTSTPNVLLDGDGMYVRLGTVISAKYLSSGMTVYGKYSSSQIEIAHLGYGPGTDSYGSSSNAPYYSLGVRSGTIGNYSVVAGNGCTASGYCSYAQGSGTTAEGSNSFAIGFNSSTNSSGRSAFAGGISAHANNQAAFAFGQSVTADYAHQTVFGKYNSNTYTSVFEIGWGTGNANRVNIFEINDAGNIRKRDSSGVSTIITNEGYPGYNAVPSWTTPTVQSSRCTINSGGYMKQGCLITVSVEFTLSSSVSRSAGSPMFTILNSLPNPQRYVALSAVLCKANSTNYYEIGACVENGSSTGNLRIASRSLALESGDKVYVTGTYFAASV